MLERLGRYDLLRRIAVGGMAEIYLAQETGLAGFQRLVVVKRILPALGLDEGFVDLFLDEARLAARLTHPKIVHIYELGHEEESYYIAMEYVPGCDLESLIAAAPGPLPLAEAMYLTGEALEGLHYAHTQTDTHGVPLGVVHRDVAPKNVLVSLDGAVKIVDFGIAKARTKATVTAPGLVMGTYSYMSPEQACGRPVDRRTDVFAAGAMLYRMLTGVSAYQAEGMRLVELVRTGTFQAPRALSSEIPESIERIVLQAMRVDPEERYPTAAHMRRDVMAASRVLDLDGDAESLATLLAGRLPHLAPLVHRWLAEEVDEDAVSEDTTIFDRDRSSVVDRLRALQSSVSRAEQDRRRSDSVDGPPPGSIDGPPPDQTDPEAPTATIELPEHGAAPENPEAEEEPEQWPADAGGSGFGLDAPATILDTPLFNDDVPTVSSDDVPTVSSEEALGGGGEALDEPLELHPGADDDALDLELPEDVERELEGRGPSFEEGQRGFAESGDDLLTLVGDSLVGDPSDPPPDRSK